MNDVTELSIKSANGDTDAFRALVEQTTPLLYRLALRMLRNESDAKDAVQDTFIRAWKSLATLRDHKNSLSWLCGVTRNTAVDMIRRRRRKSRELSLDAPLSEENYSLVEKLAGAQENPEELLASAQARAFLRSAVDDLPQKHRVVLLLREVDGLGYEEMAVALGCPRGTVESRLHRARAALAKKIRALAKGRDWRKES